MTADAQRRRNGRKPDAPTVTPITVAEAHEVFQRWLGREYDLDAIDAVLYTLAAERLGGDPLWLLLISGSGNAKTETVHSAVGIGATVVSTIASEGALLSGSPKRQTTKDSTGGLLRSIGPRGCLVIKDVTSILSMHRDTRSTVLAALREIHDGHWVRTVGTDGGRSLSWTGRLVVIGAVTTQWDRAYDVIASMGDRFVLLRMDSTKGRSAAGLQAMRNTGDESIMRQQLAGAVAGVLAGIRTERDLTLTEEELNTILAAADIVTRARTAVDFDYRGDVVDAHAPEMPTRFAKQLAQLVRGGVALGVDRRRALRLAIRCARDSMPPLRLAILLDVWKHPHTPTRDVRRRLGKPRATVDRQLQSLHMLELLECAEQEDPRGTVWHYSVVPDYDLAALVPDHVPEMSPHPSWVHGKESRASLFEDTDISGTTPRGSGPVPSRAGR